jgi:hypothetical protein
MARWAAGRELKVPRSTVLLRGLYVTAALQLVTLGIDGGADGAGDNTRTSRPVACPVDQVAARLAVRRDRGRMAPGAGEGQAPAASNAVGEARWAARIEESAVRCRDVGSRSWRPERSVTRGGGLT